MDSFYSISLPEICVKTWGVENGLYASAQYYEIFFRLEDVLTAHQVRKAKEFFKTIDRKDVPYLLGQNDTTYRLSTQVIKNFGILPAYVLCVCQRSFFANKKNNTNYELSAKSFGETGYSWKSIQRALGDLEDAGYLKRHPTARRGVVLTQVHLFNSDFANHPETDTKPQGTKEPTTTPDPVKMAVMPVPEAPEPVEAPVTPKTIEAPKPAPNTVPFAPKAPTGPVAPRKVASSNWAWLDNAEDELRAYITGASSVLPSKYKGTKLEGQFSLDRTAYLQAHGIPEAKTNIEQVAIKKAHRGVSRLLDDEEEADPFKTSESRAKVVEFVPDHKNNDIFSCLV